MNTIQVLQESFQNDSLLGNSISVTRLLLHANICNSVQEVNRLMQFADLTISNQEEIKFSSPNELIPFHLFNNNKLTFNLGKKEFTIEVVQWSADYHKKH